MSKNYSVSSVESLQQVVNNVINEGAEAVNDKTRTMRGESASTGGNLGGCFRASIGGIGSLQHHMVWICSRFHSLLVLLRTWLLRAVLSVVEWWQVSLF